MSNGLGHFVHGKESGPGGSKINAGAGGAPGAAGAEVLPYPVSRLQRQFRLGYSRSCALAESLAQRGEWTIGFTEDGTRYARLALEAPA